jgi:hypothetical protein
VLDVPVDALVHGRLRAQLVFGVPQSVRVHRPSILYEEGSSALNLGSF